VIVFKSGLAPDYFTGEVVATDAIVYSERVIDKFGEDMGWTRRRRLDIHISVEERCNQTWLSWYAPTMRSRRPSG
jgi:hypothetical protein